MSKWSRTYWADLGERVASTAVYGVITMLTADASGAVSGSARQWWVIAGLPTALSLLKGLLANLKDSDSGPSLLPAPPAPEVNEDGGLNTSPLIIVLVAIVLILVIAALLGHPVHVG